MSKVPAQQKRPLRRKLMLLMLACSSVSIILAVGGQFLSGTYLIKSTLVQTYESIINNLAENSKAAIITQKPGTAQRSLAFLDTYPDIDLACLYNASQEVIGNAFFFPDSEPNYNISQSQCPTIQESLKPHFNGNHLHIYAPVNEIDITIGTAYIRIKSDLHKTLSFHLLLMMAASFVICLLVAFLLARSLRGALSNPLTQLNNILEAIIKQRVYTSHFSFEREDEIGELATKVKTLLQRLSKAHTELRDTSYTDHISGLPNSRFFMDDLKKYLSALKRSQDPIAVLVINVEGLSNLYRDHSEKIADMAWNTMAKRLKECIRSEQIVARLSESVFATVQPDAHESWRIRSFCDRIFYCFKEPITCEENSFTATASIGISLTNDHQQNPALLVEHAQKAMQEASKKSGNTLSFYDARLQSETTKLQALTTDFSRLIDKNKVALFATPVFNLEKNTVSGLDLAPFVTPAGKPPFDYSNATQHFEDKESIKLYHKWFIRTLQAELQTYGGALYGEMDIVTWRTSIKQIYSDSFLHAMLTAGKLFEGYGVRFLAAITETDALALDATHKKMLGHKLAQSNVAFAIDIAFNSPKVLLNQSDGLPIELFRFNLSKESIANANKMGMFFNNATLKMANLKGIHSIVMNVTSHTQIEIYKESECHYGVGPYFANPLTFSNLQNFLTHPPSIGLTAHARQKQ